MALIAEHPQLIETAFVALLAGQDPNPWGKDLIMDGAEGLRIFAGEDNLAKDGTVLIAYIDGEMGDEEPPCSGNRWADVMVILRTPIQEDVDYLADHQGNAAALQSVILAQTLPDDLSDAIENFTCFGVTDRKPLREQTEGYLMSGWRIRLYSCPSAIPA